MRAVRVRGLCPRQWGAFLAREPEDVLQACVLPDGSEAVLAKVNQWVNGFARYQHDRAGADVWRTIKPGEAGDCEDIALTKRRELVEAGLPAGALRLALCRTGKGECHAVLLACMPGGELVLDNLEPAVWPWDAYGYSWLMRWAPGDWEVILERGE